MWSSPNGPLTQIKYVGVLKQFIMYIYLIKVVLLQIELFIGKKRILYKNIESLHSFLYAL